MERPPSIPEVAWATMTPELRATVVSAMETAIKRNEEEATKKMQAMEKKMEVALQQKEDEVTKQVTKKMREELKLSNLMKVGGFEADSAKALLKAATSDTHSIIDILQRLKALEMQIQDRATQVGIGNPNLILTTILNPNPLPLRRRRRARGFTETWCRPSTNDLSTFWES